MQSRSVWLLGSISAGGSSFLRFKTICELFDKKICDAFTKFKKVVK